MAVSQSLFHSLKSRPAVVSAVSVAVVSMGVYSGIGARFLSTAFAESPEPPSIFGRFGLTTLRLGSVETVNHDTKRFVFEFPDPDARSGLSLTSALLTISRPQGRWLPVLRPYTPISYIDRRGSIELMVKKYPNGKASGHFHSLVPGDTVTFAAVLKGFPWTANQFPQVHLIAGGAGITPIYQLIQGILLNPNDQTKINLIVGVNTEQDLLLKDELEGFKKHFPDRFNYLYTVSHPKGGSSLSHKGYITEELLRKALHCSEKNSKVFICGPEGLENSLMGSRKAPGILERLGFTKDQIHRF